MGLVLNSYLLVCFYFILLFFLSTVSWDPHQLNMSNVRVDRIVASCFPHVQYEVIMQLCCQGPVHQMRKRSLPGFCGLWRLVVSDYQMSVIVLRLQRCFCSPDVIKEVEIVGSYVRQYKIRFYGIHRSHHFISFHLSKFSPGFSTVYKERNIISKNDYI